MASGQGDKSTGLQEPAAPVTSAPGVEHTPGGDDTAACGARVPGLGLPTAAGPGRRVEARARLGKDADLGLSCPILTVHAQTQQKVLLRNAETARTFGGRPDTWPGSWGAPPNATGRVGTHSPPVGRW